jgi:flagellar assembly protein FliH
MPSSPEQLASVWELADLRAGAPAAPQRSGFEPAVTGVSAGRPERAPLFEVSGGASIPDSLLLQARSAAQAAGYTAGWASGLHAAQARADAEAARVRLSSEQTLADLAAGAARALSALDAAAAELERRTAPGAAELEQLIVSAALTIAEELVGHALRDDAERAPAALARVLALAPAEDDILVRLSPVDHALLTANPGPSDGVRTVTLLADDQLEPGDAVATSGATEIDARIQAGVDRVRAVLGR